MEKQKSIEECLLQSGIMKYDFKGDMEERVKRAMKLYASQSPTTGTGKGAEDAKQLQEQFEKETGKRWYDVPYTHGEIAYASWDYQLWLEAIALAKTPSVEASKAEGYSLEQMYQCALQFFYHWYNSKGNNTAQGLQEWLPTFIASLPAPSAPVEQHAKNHLGQVVKQQLVDGEFFAVFSQLFSAVMRMKNKKEVVEIDSDLLERAKAINCKYSIGGSKIVQPEPSSKPLNPLQEVTADDEKEIMIQAFDKVRQLFEMRSWIMDGRGSYPYNDDRYKEEVRYMYDEFDTIQKDTWANIESKTIDYRNKIIAQYLKDNPASQPKPMSVWVQTDKGGYAVYKIESGSGNPFVSHVELQTIYPVEQGEEVPKVFMDRIMSIVAYQNAKIMTQDEFTNWIINTQK